MDTLKVAKRLQKQGLSAGSGRTFRDITGIRFFGPFFKARPKNAGICPQSRP
ncbi:MAG: hypothetical protein AAGC64_02065 [Bacteroidota bacterium]